ncbi:MAG: alginate export family protein [Bacteroidota bacterium]
MKKNSLAKFTCCLAFVCLLSTQVNAQFTLTGQFRPRMEVRDGQGTLSSKGAVPAVFISQRSRLNFGYGGYRFKAFAALQDVRVWGQDASSINRVTTESNNALMLHEAWAEISLLDTTSKIENLTLKVGRQELVYDDVRLLGNLDWLQQARRHDMALLKFANHGWIAHLGIAFNQNKEFKSGNVFNGTSPTTAYTSGTNAIGSLYKSMQFLYLGRKFYAGNISFLALKDDFNKYTTKTAPDPVDPTKQIITNTFTQGVWSRYTLGGYIAATALKKINLVASAYYQAGKDKAGLDVDAYLLSANALYAVGRKLSVGPGIDYTSGGVSPGKTKNFDPLYGTPHKFWGYMDYFYVADGFGKNGLMDVYMKARYKPKDKLLITLDGHAFSTSNALTRADGVEVNQHLGTELDLIFNYSMTKAISIEGGYCTFFGTPTLADPMVKNIPNASLQANWAYLMITLKPDFLAK